MRKCYRVAPARRELPSPRAWLGRLVAEAAARHPDQPTVHSSEWSCPHEGCALHFLTLTLKFLPYCALPPLACPLCRRRLVFRHWLIPVELREVNGLGER